LGALAGIITLIVQYLLGLIGNALMGTGPDAATTTQTANPLAQALSVIVATGLALGLAASIGWLGGRPGAARSPHRSPQAAPITPGTSTEPRP
jgi:hypothetical protein